MHYKVKFAHGTNFSLFQLLYFFLREIHTDYGSGHSARDVEFQNVKQLFGPFDGDLYWSSLNGGFIKEEQRTVLHKPNKVNYFTFFKHIFMMSIA